MPAQQSTRFSTSAIAKRERLDFFMHALEHSLWQVTGWQGLPEDFFVEMQMSSLGCLTTVSERICAHRSHRTRADVERSAERSYHLFVATGEPWAFSHRGRHERLDRGDVVIIGEGEHETHAPLGFEGVIVKCPERWIETWVPDPERIIGRCIRGDSTWGRVLSPTLRQLSPSHDQAPALPAEVIVDHVGAVLALIAGDADTRDGRALLARIRDCIRQRCAEPGLSASQVALSLGMPPRVLHRSLSAATSTFLSELSIARADLAIASMANRQHSTPSPDETPRPAGSSPASQAERVTRRRAATVLERRGD